MLLKCKDCKYYVDADNMQICNRSTNWEITKPNAVCKYQPQMVKLTCGDCWCQKFDPGCAGVTPNDSPFFDGKLCPDFTDLKEEVFRSVLSFWKSRGIYDRKRINKLIDTFESDYEDLAGQITETKGKLR